MPTTACFLLQGLVSGVKRTVWKGRLHTRDPANWFCSGTAKHLMLEVHMTPSLLPDSISHHQNKKHHTGEKRGLQTTLRSSVTGLLFPPLLPMGKSS